MADLEGIYQQLLGIVGKLTAIGETQKAVLSRLTGVEAKVEGHQDALTNGVRAEVREIRDRFADYLGGGRERTCLWRLNCDELEIDRRVLTQERRGVRQRIVVAVVTGLIMLFATQTVILARVAITQQAHLEVEE